MKKDFVKIMFILTALLGIQRGFSQEPLEYLFINHLGAVKDVDVMDMEIDSQGNVYVAIFTLTGSLSNNDSIIGTDANYYLLKYDPEGELLFSFAFVPPPDSGHISIGSIKITHDDNILCTGIVKGVYQFGGNVISCENGNGFICLILADGTPQQFECLNYSDNYVVAKNFEIDDEDNVYFAGYSQDTIFYNQNNDTIYAPQGTFKMPVCKLDADFNLQWLKVFTGDYNLVGNKALTMDNDNNVIIFTKLSGSNLYYDDEVYQTNESSSMVFIKMTDSGDVIWIENATGLFDNIYYNVCCDNENNIYFAAEHHSTIVFDTIEISPVSIGGETLILSLTGDGDFRWYSQIHNTVYAPAYITPNDITIHNDNLYLAGGYIKSVYFNNILVNPVSDFYDTYITKIDKTTGDYQWIFRIYGDNIPSTDWLSFGFYESYLYISGPFSGQGTFGNTVLQSQGQIDNFIIKFNDKTVNIEETAGEITSIVYPNPGGNEFFINTESENNNIQLFDQTGRILIEEKFKSKGLQNINTSSLPAGLYIYRLTDENGNTTNGKWIKKQ